MKDQQMINYWLKSAQEDIITAESLFNAQRFLPCLFYCHLFIEKIIKAVIIKNTKKDASYGHKLSRLAKSTNLPFTQKQVNLLNDLTAFNIKARYQDYKFSLYKKADKTYTLNYLAKAKELYIWIKTNL